MKRTIALALLDEQRPIVERRPAKRADCERGLRPCPWIGCRHNLYEVDVIGAERDKIAIGDHLLDVDSSDHEIEQAVDTLVANMSHHETCSLDVAAREADGATLELVGNILGVTRERIRQIEKKALDRMPRALIRRLGLGRADLHEPTAPVHLRQPRRPSR